jgi:hypothetical protein
MTDPTSHPEFDLDTALSASLDGELEAYAVELGVEPDELRRALAAPEAAARRSELAAVRRALAEEPEPSLDDVTRRRLLAGAGVGTASPAPARRDRSRWLQAGIAAAVTLVLLGAIYAITRDTGGSDGSSAKSSASGGATEAAVTGDVGDLGVVDPRVVAKLLHGERPSTTTSGGSFAQEAPAQSITRDQAGTPAVSPQAVDACATRYATDGTIRFRGSGSFGGRPAVVLGIDAGKRTIVFVVAAADCAQVLYSASR